MPDNGDAARRVATASTQTCVNKREVVVSDHKVSINFGRNCRDAKPKSTILTMTELATRFSKPDATRGTLALAEYLALDKSVTAQKAIRAAQKDGEYFIPAVFSHAGTRNAAGVTLVEGFTGDIDTGTVFMAELKANLAGLQYIAYSSYSHQADDPRWRLFVPYVKPITPAEHGKVYDFFQRRFRNQLDARCKTTNQLWYTPACPHDAVGQFEFFVGQGDLLDVDTLPETSKQPTPQNTNIADPGVRGSLATMMETVCVDGQRTDHALSLAGALIASGTDLAGCISSCLAWNARNQSPLDDDKVEQICQSIHNADLRNHPERHQIAANDALFDISAGRIDTFLNTAPPPRRWLINELIAVGKVGAIVAPGGSSKSQLMLQIGTSVATGIDLANHWKVGETGGVLMLCAEDDREEIHRRVHRINSHLTARGHAKTLAALPKGLFVFSTVGIDTLLTKRQPQGEVSPTAIIQRIVALAAQIPDLKLIIIDPVSRFRGGEENSNEDGARFVEALEQIAKLSGAAVLIAHHASKASTGGGEVTQGASRGASSLTDGVRWQMNLSPPTDKQLDALGLMRTELSGHVMATVTKSNYSLIPPPAMFKREDGGYLTVVSAGQARSGAEIESIIRVLRIVDSAGSALTMRQLENQHAGVKKEILLSKERLRAVLKRAIELGVILGGDRQTLTITLAGPPRQNSCRLHR